MEAFRIVVVLQALVCCEALQDLSTPKSPDGKESNLYVSQTSRPCSWTVSSRGENQSLVLFTEGSLDPLAAHVCQTLGCGKVYKIISSAADPNASCFTGCIYHKNTLNNCSQAAGGSCRAVSEVICAAPYIAAASGYCVWNLRSPENELAVVLTEDAVGSLPSEVCQSLGCGDALPQSRTRAPPNSTCLTGCVYHNFHLRNCSTVVSSDCSQLSTVECGNRLARLSGGSHHCGGRMELWRGGQWGTVCDDEWDKKDADVVCAQLGCGYAISVSGQGQPYGQGRGPIHLDELNCTGKERSLWECPAVKDHHDCGHKEDAGVVCSEYKALRLTGGLDRCSGRVEIHRNGSWGTVCDDSWAKEEASMACAMLGCGSAVEYTGFEEPFTHKNGTRWFYICDPTSTNLWECKEIDASSKRHICIGIKAAGLVCSNSQGLPKPTTPKATTPALTTMQMTTAGPTGFWTLELLGCIGLSCALLIALITNIILCCLARKKRALKIQQQYTSLQTAAGAEENNYRDAIHLVKVTSNEPQLGAQIMPPQMWTQSSVESGDTDYDPSDSGPDTPFPLSTFRNSMRHSAESRNPALKSANLHSVTEEDSGASGNAAMRGHQQQPYTANGTFHGLTAALSEDSFETSSTSSGECYENTGLGENYENTGDDRNDLQTATLPYPDPPSYSTENFNQPEDLLQNQSNGFISNQGFNMEPSCEDYSHIYSPVSADADPYSSDSDYDDVGCLQRPH